MSLPDNDYKIIEDFIHGRLRNDSIFRSKLTNPKFKREYENQRAKREEFLTNKKAKLVTLLKEEFRKEREQIETITPDTPNSDRIDISRAIRINNPRFIWLGIAATFTIFIFALFNRDYFFPQKTLTTSKIVNLYWKIEPSDDHIITEASTSFNEEVVNVLHSKIKNNYDSLRFNQALQLIRQCTSTCRTYGIKLLEANICMKIGNFEEASKILEKIIEDNKSRAYVAKAKWHLAINYFMQKNRTNEGIEILEKIANGKNNFKKQEAKEILKNI